MSPDLEELGMLMQRKWEVTTAKKKSVEIDEKIFEQRLEELADIFYDAFCELHKNCSVEPKQSNSCDERELRKAG